MTILTENAFWLITLTALCLSVWFNVGTFLTIKSYMKTQYHRYDSLSESVHKRFEKIEYIMQQCGDSILKILLELKALNTLERG